MNGTSGVQLSPHLSDAMLRLAPVNVLLLDDRLVCRYAAPVGDALEGRRPDEVLGRPVTEVLSAARDGLRPVLERAARQATAWRNPEYRFRVPENGGERPCCWSVTVDPVATDGFRGVLVSWTEIEEQRVERERLHAEIDHLRAESRERNAALVHALSDLRNAVTPLSGYLQVIVRHPALLKGRTPAEVIAEYVMPRVADVLAVADRLRLPPIFSTEANGSPGPSGAGRAPEARSGDA